MKSFKPLLQCDSEFQNRAPCQTFWIKLVAAPQRSSIFKMIPLFKSTDETHGCSLPSTTAVCGVCNRCPYTDYNYTRVPSLDRIRPRTRDTRVCCKCEDVARPMKLNYTTVNAHSTVRHLSLKVQIHTENLLSSGPLSVL